MDESGSMLAGIIVPSEIDSMVTSDYRSFGFDVSKNIFAGMDSPPLWLMWRSPGT